VYELVHTANVPIPVNTANWSGSAGFDSVAPSAWADGWGYVYLQGAVTQTQPSFEVGDPDVLATLPPAFWPQADVYVLAHSFNGTYVQLTPAGQIDLIYARAPLFTQAAVVSLEGISYQP
jgi:hypothetical protein